MAFFDFRFKPYRQNLNNPPELDVATPSIEIDSTRTKINAAQFTEYGIATLADGTTYDFQSILGGYMDLISTDLSDALDNSLISSLDLIWIGEGSVSINNFQVSLAEFQALDGPDELSKLGGDTVWGSEFDDYLNSDVGNDWIKGFGGDDTIVGGSGEDKVIFRGFLNDYAITSNGDHFTIKDNRSQSPDGVDTVSDVEIYEFSDQILSEDELKLFANKLPEPTPAEEINEVRGTQGNDKLKAKSLNASIYGMDGNDKIFGSNGDDILSGGFGNDKIKGKSGKDLFICLHGKDVIKDYDIDEGDAIQVNGEFSITKKKKHTLIEHEGGSVLVKKTNPKYVNVEDSDILESMDPNVPEDNSDYLEQAKQSTIPSKKGNIKGTAGDDIIEVQRYYKDAAYLYDKIKIGSGTDLLVFDKSPSYRIWRNGIEIMGSSDYWLNQFDPLTGDKLLFDSTVYNKYDNILATANTMEEVFDLAQTSTSFIRYNDYLYYNKNGSSQGLDNENAVVIDYFHAKLILFNMNNQNLDSLSQAIEFI
jgi:Ca2+-binding RTX toxin-like protein